MISLNEDEKILLRMKKHWGYLIMPLIVSGFTGGLLFPWFVYRLLRFLTDEMIITNQKFYVKIGIISKEIFEMPLEDMSNVAYEQGLFGRTLNYGTFHFRSVAIAGISACEGISNPEMAKAVLERAIKQKKADQTSKSAQTLPASTNIVINAGTISATDDIKFK